MVKYKKLFALTLLIMAIGVVVTGCTGSPAPEGGESSLEEPAPADDPATGGGMNDQGGDLNGHIFDLDVNYV